MVLPSNSNQGKREFKVLLIHQPTRRMQRQDEQTQVTSKRENSQQSLRHAKAQGTSTFAKPRPSLRAPPYVESVSPFLFFFHSPISGTITYLSGSVRNWRTDKILSSYLPIKRFREIRALGHYPKLEFDQGFKVVGVIKSHNCLWFTHKPMRTRVCVYISLFGALLVWNYHCLFFFVDVVNFGVLEFCF